MFSVSLINSEFMSPSLMIQRSRVASHTRMSGNFCPVIRCSWCLFPYSSTSSFVHWPPSPSFLPPPPFFVTDLLLPSSTSSFVHWPPPPPPSFVYRSPPPFTYLLLHDSGNGSLRMGFPISALYVSAKCSCSIGTSIRTPVWRLHNGEYIKLQSRILPTIRTSLRLILRNR